MSSYITIIAMLMLVLSPLLIPTALTVVHALAKLRANYRVINRVIAQPRRVVRLAA
jgi:hypothetical protein